MIYRLIKGLDQPERNISHHLLKKLYINYCLLGVKHRFIVGNNFYDTEIDLFYPRKIWPTCYMSLYQDNMMLKFL